jgi:hypothetical protein
MLWVKRLVFDVDRGARAMASEQDAGVRAALLREDVEDFPRCETGLGCHERVNFGVKGLEV